MRPSIFKVKPLIFSRSFQPSLPFNLMLSNSIILKRPRSRFYTPVEIFALIHLNKHCDVFTFIKIKFSNLGCHCLHCRRHSDVSHLHNQLQGRAKARITENSPNLVSLKRLNETFSEFF